MKPSKREIKDLISRIIDELPLPEASAEELSERGDELSDREALALENSVRDALARSLQQMFVVKTYVVCMMKNNVERVDIKDAVKCAGCGFYYCEKHKLTHCPNSNCGHTIP